MSRIGRMVFCYHHDVSVESLGVLGSVSERCEEGNNCSGTCHEGSGSCAR